MAGKASSKQKVEHPLQIPGIPKMTCGFIKGNH